MTDYPFSMQILASLQRCVRPLAILGEERLVAAVAAAVLTLLNVVQVASLWHLYGRTTHVGFYTLYSKTFHLSGYDAWSCVFLSNGHIYFETMRHPLFLTVLFPLRWLNALAMEYLHVNLSMPLMATVVVLLGMWAAVFFFRLMRQVLQLPLDEARSLTLLLFGLGHVLVPLVCPDHFAFSFFLLSLTLWLVGRMVQQQRSLSTVQWGVLIFLTTGLAPTNGAKVVLTALQLKRRAALRWRWWTVAVLLPLLLVGGIYAAQYYMVERPRLEERQRRDQRMIETQRKRNNKKFFAERAKRYEWIKRNTGKTLGNGTVTSLIDVSTPRWREAWDNVLGEGLLLHRAFLLLDPSFDRPAWVAYRQVWPYAVQCLLLGLLIVGAWRGRRNALMHTVLLWMGLDLLLCLGLGFAIREGFLLTSGWAFALPVAAALLLASLHGRWRRAMNSVVTALAVFLSCYHSALLVIYLLVHRSM